METPANSSVTAAVPAICPTCHQPVKPEYYFCPNCGTKLNSPPLPTSVGAQIGLYAFSIVLPVICFLAVTKWQGNKYFKSADPKTKNIGIIAWTLLVASTIFSFWYATVWIQNQVQSATNTIDSELNSY